MVFYRQRLFTSIVSQGAEGREELVSSKGHMAKDKGDKGTRDKSPLVFRCRGQLLSANISLEVWLLFSELLLCSRHWAKMLSLHWDLI